MRGAVPRLMRPGMRSDREEPVLDRLRGVMRVGCSGARSEESSRWAATRAAAALRSNFRFSRQGELLTIFTTACEAAAAVQIVHRRGHYKWATRVGVRICNYNLASRPAGSKMLAKMKPATSVRSIASRSSSAARNLVLELAQPTQNPSES